MRHAADISCVRSQLGVTLVEMIVAILVTGILLSMVGMFTRNQIASYFDIAARAELSDAADTALRRIARDLQGALPNSVRVSAANDHVEFVPIRDAGRYRAQSGGGGEDWLDFTSITDGSFDVLGPAVTVSNGEQLVVYNLGIPGADVYSGTTRRALTSTGTLNNLSYTVGGTQFPLASPQSRFHVVGGPVSYACAPNPGNPEAGTITRHWCYAFQAVQPADFVGAPPGNYSTCVRTSAILVTGVSACSLAYAPGAQQRNGLVSMRLTLSRNGESVSLLHQVNVVNTP